MPVISTSPSTIMSPPHASGGLDSGILDNRECELTRNAGTRRRSGVNGIQDILQAPSLEDVMLWVSEDQKCELPGLDEHERKQLQISYSKPWLITGIMMMMSMMIIMAFHNPLTKFSILSL